MSKVLVVFEEIPETVSFVVLEVPETELPKLQSFHGHYVNGGETPESLAKEINDYFYDNYGPFRYDKVSTPLTNVNFDLVIYTGFVL